MSVIVELTEDEVRFTVADGWRLSEYVVTEEGRFVLVAVVETD